MEELSETEAKDLSEMVNCTHKWVKETEQGDSETDADLLSQICHSEW
jgi:hypothetical protein